MSKYEYSAADCCRSLKISIMTFHNAIKKMGISRKRTTSGKVMYRYDIREVSLKYLEYEKIMPKRKRTTTYKEKKRKEGMLIKYCGVKMVCGSFSDGLLVFNQFHKGVELKRAKKQVFTEFEFNQKIESGDAVILNKYT